MPDYPLPNNACDLTGQVALVTGTTSGLGWRFARVLAAAGASVALTGRRKERLDELAALYSITKSAIVRMTECLATEWARNYINVNCIAPGSFNSEMLDGMMERVGDFSNTFPRKRMCDPALLDSTLLYLCSPASEAVTGTVIRVDDGQGPR